MRSLYGGKRHKHALRTKHGLLATSLLSMAALALIFLTSGCSDGQKVFRIGIVPGMDMTALQENSKPMVEYLKRELGVEEVEFSTATDYTGVIEAMANKHIDAALFGPFSYVLAHKRANAEAIAAGGDKETGKLTGYYSTIVVLKETGITSIDDLKAKAKEIDFAFVDPASTSGNLVPRGYLTSVGIDPDKDFRNTIFAGGHDAVAAALASGKVQAGAIFLPGYEKAVQGGVLDPEKVQIIWKSSEIPHSPWSVRSDVDEGLKKKLQQALLEVAEKDPEAMKSIVDTFGEKEECWVKATDSDYQYIRDLAESQGML